MVIQMMQESKADLDPSLFYHEPPILVDYKYFIKKTERDIVYMCPTENESTIREFVTEAIKKNLANKTLLYDSYSTTKQCKN